MLVLSSIGIIAWKQIKLETLTDSVLVLEKRDVSFGSKMSFT